MRKDIYRIIDANFNRCREGLRVCEDISRFIMNSSSIARDLKSVRHAVAERIKASRATARILLESRDAAGDVGRCLVLPSEMQRIDYGDIFAANVQRVKESLRVLEEFFKIIDMRSAAKFLELRFKVYGIEKRAIRRIDAARRHR